MTDDEKLARVKKINSYMNEINTLRYSVYDLDFTQYRLAGTNDWAGDVKSNKFDEAYHEAASQLAKVDPEIQEAIATCKSKMYSLAWSIKDVAKKAQALAIATF